MSTDPTPRFTTGPSTYRALPRTVEAWEVTEENVAEVAAWCGGFGAHRVVVLVVDESSVPVRVGDLVVRELDGSFSRRRPVEFEGYFERETHGRGGEATIAAPRS